MTTVNTIEYSETGNACWQNPLPTFLIDGQDIAEWLEVTWLAGNGVSAIGVDATHPFIYPGPSIFNQVQVGNSAREFALSIDFGDCVGAFATVLVDVDDATVHWRDFQPVDGARTQLAACGPFAFDRKEYAAIMRSAIVPTFASLKKLQMYSHVDDQSFDGLW